VRFAWRESNRPITESTSHLLAGFLTACVAGIIVRSEMWLFDLKDGYCAADWRKARRFCCSAEVPSRTGGLVQALAVSYTMEKCDAWRSWSETFQGLSREGRLQGAGWLIDYAVYLLLAVCAQRATGISYGYSLITKILDHLFVHRSSHDYLSLFIRVSLQYKG
jgi:hypothetical protein